MRVLELANKQGGIVTVPRTFRKCGENLTLSKMRTVDLDTKEW